MTFFTFHVCTCFDFLQFKDVVQRLDGGRPQSQVPQDIPRERSQEDQTGRVDGACWRALDLPLGQVQSLFNFG